MTDLFGYGVVGDDDLVPAVYELPYDLFDTLVSRLPPLTLQKLQTEMYTYF